MVETCHLFLHYFIEDNDVNSSTLYREQRLYKVVMNRRRELLKELVEDYLQSRISAALEFLS